MYLKNLKIPVLIFLLLIPLRILSQDSPDERFARGGSYFSSGDYTKALEEWTGLYSAGYRSAELEYNIGNAYFKLNNTPGAILFFERAHLRKPADEDINYNLQIASTLVVDRLDEIPELFFVKWYNFMSLLLSSNSWAWVSLTTFVLCLVSISVYFYTSKFRLKVVGFWLAITLLVISLASLAFTIRNKNLLYDSNKAIIFSPVVNGKSSPDNSGTDLFVIHEGLKVTVEDELGDWREIRLPDGNKGWVPANSLEVI